MLRTGTAIIDEAVSCFFFTVVESMSPKNNDNIYVQPTVFLKIALSTGVIIAAFNKLTVFAPFNFTGRI